VLNFGSIVIADAVLVVELAMAAALVVGMFLARTGRIRVHSYWQSAIVLGNVPIVLVWMLPAYLQDVWPGLPGEIGQPFYWVPTLMLALGIVVEALGAYVVLVAGTNWMPERLRFRRYKLWMRTLLVLWWVVLLTGIATYYVWFLSPGSS
jgi:uncharacterized membrane protein YozB (DUF420 family)